MENVVNKVSTFFRQLYKIGKVYHRGNNARVSRRFCQNFEHGNLPIAVKGRNK